ncbi:Ovarian cancer-associated protein 2 [Phlyctochytrium planicorne]|nr:Ovarian cancer-associated protein 2 [Phlyctochytrium planicorne]
MRILCLHAYGHNAEQLQKRMTYLHNDLSTAAELVYLTAPALQPYTPEEGQQDTLMYQKTLENAPDAPRVWWWLDAARDDCLGFQESLAYLKNYWLQHGPFDGIFGFAQGASMALYLAIDLLYPLPSAEPQPILQPPRFLVFVSAFLSVAPAHEGYLDRVEGKIPIPSLHVYAQADPWVATRRSKEVAERFRRGYVLCLEHPAGHMIPQGKDIRPLITGFVSLFAPASGAPAGIFPIPVPLPVVPGLIDPHEDEDAVQVEGFVDEEDAAPPGEEVEDDDIAVEGDGDMEEGDIIMDE